MGLLTEVLLDDRGGDAPTPLQDDVFVGSRLAFNDIQDTQLLAGVIMDRKSGGSLMSVEASRRLSDGWTGALEARAFWGAEREDLLYGLRQDDYLSLMLRRHF